MSGTSGSPWLDPRMDVELTRLWVEGVSASKIGRELGVTKNSVIGRAHRIGLHKRLSPVPLAGMRTKPVVVAVPRVAKVSLPILATVKEVKMERPRDTFRTVPFRECQWTDCHRAPWVMCGKPVCVRVDQHTGQVGPASWCEEHYGRVYGKVAA